MAATADDKKGLLDRGLAILDHLAEVREASTIEFGALLGISRSTAYRLVDRLEETGYLESTTAGRWRLGPSAARLAMAAVRSAEVTDVAPELLRALSQQTRETAGLAVLSGHEMIFVYREAGPQSVRVSTELGARRPLHATSIGKAYLAALPSAEAGETIRRLDLESFTDATITTRAGLEGELARIRERGWSEERREFDAASACCGAAILDHTGRPIAAISAAGLATRIEPVMNRVGPLVAATAEAISRRIGYRPEMVR